MVRKSQRDELLRQLAFIDDPVKRFQEMLRHKLILDAEEALRAMIQERSPIYFQDPSRGDYASELVEPTKKKRTFHISIGSTMSGSMQHAECNIDPEGLRKAMRWSKEQLNEFLIGVMRRAITTVDPTNLREKIASWAGSWEITATIRAMEEFLPQEHELRRPAELWCLRAWIFTGATILYDWREAQQERYLGRKIENGRVNNGDGLRGLDAAQRGNRKVVEAAITRLRELGMTDDEIREDWYAWLDRYVGRINPDVIIGMASVSIFPWKHRQRRAEIMARQTGTAVEWMMEGRELYHPVVVAGLIDCGMLEGASEGKALYRKHAAEKLAEGRLGHVAQITSMVGVRFFGEEYYGPEKGLKFDLKECAAQAFDIAWRKGEYGIAAALVNQFGEEACLDPELLRSRVPELLAKEGDDEDADVKLAELVNERKAQIQAVHGLAKTTNKPVRFDYSLRFVDKL